jgi:hypothetical protein
MPSEIDQFVANATLKNSYLILNNVPQWLKRLRKTPIAVIGDNWG